jgi:heme exporter protein D
MHWNSVDDFLAMGGYGFYVWGSMIVTGLAIALETVLLRQRRKRVEIIQKARIG